MSKNIKKAIKSYFSENKRVNKILNSLVPLLNSSKDPVYQIKKRVKETQNPLKLFKALMLIHVCYLRNVLNYRGVLKLLTYIKPKQDSKIYLKKVLGTQVIPQYKLYLQLCYQTKIQQSIQGKKKEQKNQKYSQSQAMEEIYKNITLLKHGLDFVQILFLFGRYYRFEYFFIVDFNILLAKDLQVKYNRIASFLNEFKQIENNALLEKLEKLHEGLYVVYYNCYYHPETKRFQPNWIETDVKNINANHNQTFIQGLDNISELVQLYEQIMEQKNKRNNNLFQTDKKQVKTHKKQHKQLQLTKDTQKRQTGYKQFFQFTIDKTIDSHTKEPIAQISQFQANQDLCESEQLSIQEEESNEKLNEAVCQSSTIFDDSYEVDDRQQKFNGISTSEFNEVIQLAQICGNEDNIMALIAQNKLKI